ncbi:hypothetical protein ACFL1B_03350 [Nanoarchaeota archaeon]
MSFLKTLDIVRSDFKTDKKKILDAGNPHHHESSSRRLGLRIWDVDADKPEPMKYSLGDFSDGKTLERFIKDNNDFVELAVQFGVVLPQETYNRFFELGMRISQQLPGRFRDINIGRYKEVGHALDDAVVEGIHYWKQEQKENKKGTLLAMSQGVPEADMPRVECIIDATMTEKESKIEKLVRDLAEDSTEWRIERPKVGYLTRKTHELERDQDANFFCIYEKVPDELKADFLEIAYFGFVYEFELPKRAQEHIARMERLGQDPGIPTLNPALVFMDDVYEIIEGLSIESARTFLDYAGHHLMTEYHADFYHDVVDTYMRTSGHLEPEQKDFFFEILKLTMEQGLPGTGLYAAEDAVEMQDFASEGEVTAAVQTACDTYHRTKDLGEASRKMDDLKGEAQARYQQAQEA